MNFLQNYRSEYDFKIKHLTKNEAAIFIRFPFAYNDFTYTCTGFYESFIPDNEILDSEPEGDKEISENYGLHICSNLLTTPQTPSGDTHVNSLQLGYLDDGYVLHINANNQGQNINFAVGIDELTKYYNKTIRIEQTINPGEFIQRALPAGAIIYAEASASMYEQRRIYAYIGSNKWVKAASTLVNIDYFENPNVSADISFVDGIDGDTSEYIRIYNNGNAALFARINIEPM